MERWRKIVHYNSATLSPPCIAYEHYVSNSQQTNEEKVWVTRGIILKIYVAEKRAEILQRPPNENLKQKQSEQ